MTREPRSPRVPALRLHDLTDASVPVAAAGDIVEAHRISGIHAETLALEGLTFTECHLDRWQAGRVTLSASRLMDVRITEWGVPVLVAPRLNARAVELDGSRLGAVDLHGAGIMRAHLSGSKLDWVNLRAAELTDVEVQGCTFDEIDLTDARLTRVAFRDCSVGTLNLHNTRLEHVDLRGLQLRAVNGPGHLRGATISPFQLGELAPQLASHLGINVRD